MMISPAIAIATLFKRASRQFEDPSALDRYFGAVASERLVDELCKRCLDEARAWLK